MNKQKKKKLFEKYIIGWKSNNREQILSVLTEDCIIVECYGPMYQDKEQVQQWIDDWINSDHYVNRWEIYETLFDDIAGTAAFVWEFECFANNKHHRFKGSSIVKYNNGLIKEIKEFRMEPNHYFPYK